MYMTRRITPPAHIAKEALSCEQVYLHGDGALAERLNEILLEMPKKTPYKERKAEADEALEKFWAMLEGNEALQEQLDDVLSLMRAYAFDQNRACYLQGVRDFRGLMLGTVPTLEEGDDSDGE